MGNKSTFVMLFLFVTFSVQNIFSATESMTDICGKTITCTYGEYNKVFCKRATKKSGQCKLVIGHDDSQCPNLSAVPQQTCAAKKPLTRNTEAVAKVSLKTETSKIGETISSAPSIKAIAPATTTSDELSCGLNTVDGAKVCSDFTKSAHMHCVCKLPNVEGEAAKTFVVSKDPGLNEVNNCPSAAPVATEKAEVKEKAAATGLDCLQNIRNQINACKDDASNSINACDMKSENNSGTKQKLSALAQAAQQFIHVGTAVQCKNMGLVTSAAGYGLSEIQGNCRAEMKSCQNSCKDLSKYTDPEEIKNSCTTATPESAAKLKEEAEELAAVMSAANKECITKSEMLLQQVGSAITNATSAYQSAAVCENQLSASPVLQNINLSNCLANPNAAGCPVNCATNSTNPQCTCLVNPQAAGCQGGKGSEMAGNPNGLNQNLPSLSGAGGLSSKAGSVGGGGGDNLGDLNMGDASEKNPLDQKPTDVPATAALGAAPPAVLGGISGNGPGDDGKGKNGKAEPASEDHSLFGGVFQNLKNAAGSLFGSSGSGNSSSSKKSTAVTNGVNAAGLKPVAGNNALRGIASNGKSCFVDAKGTEFCFGKKNMDIFKMMNSQYGNQYNTLIIDK